jgi:hypothetical protein
MERGIDIEKSIKTGWVYAPHGEDTPTWKRILFAIYRAFPYNLVFIAALTLLIVSKLAEVVMVFQIPLGLFGIYGIVGSYYSSKLIKVKTEMTANKAQSELVNYYKKRGDNIALNGNRLVIVKEYTGTDATGENYYEYTFIFEDNALYYTLYKQGSRANSPAVFTRLFTKYELRKLFAN